jgi:branched-chain amino acid transport system permease protein
MDLFVQQLVNGLTLGSVYALIALGYSLVYGVLRLLNFAHGDVYMIGGFIGYGVLTLAGGPSASVIPVAPLLVLMFAAAMLGCGLLGVGIERVAFRPLRRAPRIAPLISSLGLSFVLSGSMLLHFGADYRNYDTFALGDGVLLLKGVDLEPLHVSLIRLIVIVSALSLMLVLHLLVKRTTFGKSLRATAYDAEAAAMMGIDVDRVIARAFFIGSALAGAAGVMIGLVFFQVNYFMGFVAGLKGFTAAVIGGIGSIPGAMLGGLLLGFGEAFITGYLTSTFQLLIIFSVLILVMLVRPRGLLGQAPLDKV